MIDFFKEVTTNNSEPTDYVRLITSDMRMISVAKYEIITSDFGTKEKEVIKLLKQMQVDGETMQYILDEVGMSEQMLNQLVRTVGLDEVAKIDVLGDSFDRRAELIQDDVLKVRGLMAKPPLTDEFKDEVFSCLNNIGIITDWDSDECKEWSLYGSTEVRRKEFELKEKVYNAMNELNSHWQDSDVTYTLDDDYPFKQSFDEVCLEVSNWVGKK